MGPGDTLSLMTLVIAVAAVFILRGPMGRALAERISGRASMEGPVARDFERQQSELEDVKRRLAEVEERLDFAERLLAQQKQAALGRGG